MREERRSLAGTMKGHGFSGPLSESYVSGEEEDRADIVHPSSSLGFVHGARQAHQKKQSSFLFCFRSCTSFTACDAAVKQDARSSLLGSNSSTAPGLLVQTGA